MRCQSLAIKSFLTIFIFLTFGFENPATKIRQEENDTGDIRRNVTPPTRSYLGYKLRRLRWLRKEGGLKGTATGSKDNSEGIEITVKVDDLPRGSQLRFRFSRREVDSNSAWEELKVDDRSNTIFDDTAVEEILYEYQITIILNGKDFKLETKDRVEGIRPKARIGSVELDFLKAKGAGNKIFLSWSFKGLDPKDVPQYHLQITTAPDHQWSDQRGMSGNKKGTFQNRSTPENSLELLNTNNTKKIWVCIRAIYKDGSTKFFHRELIIHKVNTVAGLIPEERPAGLLQNQFLSAVAEVQPNKTYGLSFIPERTPAVERTHTLAAIGPREYLSKPTEILDHLIGDYFDKLFSQSSAQADAGNCLEPYVVVNNSCHRAASMAADPELSRRQALGSNCVSYEVNTMKLSVRMIPTTSGDYRREVDSTPNEYAMINKYRRTQGLFVLMELPEPGELNEEMIRDLQRKLKQLGFYRGPDDGQLNPRMRIAILDFQKRRQLPIGNLDVNTLRHLGILLQ